MIFLLILIYITFISLGLPDSLFGVSWPLMHLDFGISESFASVFMIITGIGSGGSSLFAGKLIRKFGTGKVTFFSVLLTAAGLLGVSFSTNIVSVIIFTILLGLGAGAVDSGLNNFVSLHYKAIHMNWLHCFWGVGVTLSPLIMSYFLKNNDWHGGYRSIAIIQFTITALLFFTLPLWKKAERKEDIFSSDNENKKPKTALEILKIKGVPFAILSLGFYCSMEFIIGTWGATYIINTHGLSADIAAKWIALYYGGIMLGRFISGILSIKISDKNLIRSGVVLCLIGIIFLALPLGNISLVGFLLIGIGFAPVFPSTLHATPSRFGKEYSADITGFQMGGGYALAWAVQIAFGYIASATTFAFMPFLLIALNICLFIVCEVINRKTAK